MEILIPTQTCATQTCAHVLFIPPHVHGPAPTVEEVEALYALPSRPRTFAEWMSAWVEALRSGRYRQMRGELAGRENLRCAVGVLMEIARTPLETDSYDGLEIALGIEPKAREPFEEFMYHVIVMNDKAGLSFEEIAVFIEQNFNLPCQ